MGEEAQTDPKVFENSCYTQPSGNKRYEVQLLNTYNQVIIQETSVYIGLSKAPYQSILYYSVTYAKEASSIPTKSF